MSGLSGSASNGDIRGLQDEAYAPTASTITPSGAWPRHRRPPSSVQHASSHHQPFPSRPPSPFPAASPSRTGAPRARSWLAQANRSASGPTSDGTSQGSPARTTSPALTSIWGAPGGAWETSWSSLQGLASSMLGGGEPQTERRKGRTNPGVRPTERRTSSEGRARWRISPAGPLQWGPQPKQDTSTTTTTTMTTTTMMDHVGTGTSTRDSTDARWWARRREGLLVADAHAFPDSRGNYKRRMSDERRPSGSGPAADDGREAAADEEETLVYVHHVRPQDTVAGVIIQYGCQPAVFRQANRLWPNDPMPSRQTVLLPVDACHVCRRPADAEADHPAAALEDDDEGSEPAGSATLNGAASPVRLRPKAGPRPRPPPLLLAPSPTAAHDHPPWRHDAWVRIDGLPEIVEVVCMPRKTLGYFPPRRRRSLSATDVEPSSNASTNDLPPAGAGAPAAAHPRPGGKRSGSGTGPTLFAHHLQGPGGVGSLGADVHSPGPAPDSLHKFLAPHFPRLAPSLAPAPPSLSSPALPRDSFDSVTSSVSTGLEHVGSAIEGWVKKVATRAAAAIAETSAAAAAAAAAAGAAGTAGRRGGAHGDGEGDLIELADGFDGSDDDGLVRPSMLQPPAQSPSPRPPLPVPDHFPIRTRIGGPQEPAPPAARRRKGD
ncbi:MAG: hypothetical protein M1826_006021 [Phylliscum demangeonii]|nr:MAG: hypothetical protein M1826_006021 [Phylliscum demangeonii]